MQVKTFILSLAFSGFHIYPPSQMQDSKRRRCCVKSNEADLNFGVARRYNRNRNE